LTYKSDQRVNDEAEVQDPLAMLFKNLSSQPYI
jgi:hypothetical protein